MYEAVDDSYVLVIDDDELIWVLIRDVLRHLGLLKGLRTFPDAELALQFLRQSDVAPAIMIVDLNLPGMDGFDFLEHFCAEMLPSCSQTRIHMVSGSNSPSDRMRAEADPIISSYYNKPLRLEHLRDMLNPASLVTAGH